MIAAKVLIAVAGLLGVACLIEFVVDEIRDRLGIFKIIDRKD